MTEPTIRALLERAEARIKELEEALRLALCVPEARAHEDLADLVVTDRGISVVFRWVPDGIIYRVACDRCPNGVNAATLPPLEPPFASFDTELLELTAKRFITGHLAIHPEESL